MVGDIILRNLLIGTIRLVDPQHDTPNLKSDTIDMSYPRSLMERDRIGYQNLIVGVKHIVFGDPRYYMTRKRCEDFFDNDDNFLV